MRAWVVLGTWGMGSCAMRLPWLAGVYTPRPRRLPGMLGPVVTLATNLAGWRVEFKVLRRVGEGAHGAAAGAAGRGRRGVGRGWWTCGWTGTYGGGGV